MRMAASCRKVPPPCDIGFEGGMGGHIDYARGADMDSPSFVRTLRLLRAHFEQFPYSFLPALLAGVDQAVTLGSTQEPMV